MVETRHLQGIVQMAQHLNCGKKKLEALIRSCEENSSLPKFPAHRLDDKGPWRTTSVELDVWYSAYVKKINEGRTPYMQKVSPLP